jgi:hypothetical protein
MHIIISPKLTLQTDQPQKLSYKARPLSQQATVVPGFRSKNPEYREDEDPYANVWAPVPSSSWGISQFNPLKPEESGHRYTSCPLPQTDDTVRHIWVRRKDRDDSGPAYGCLVTARGLYTYMEWDKKHSNQSTLVGHPPPGFSSETTQYSDDNWARILRARLDGQLVSCSGFP